MSVASTPPVLSAPAARQQRGRRLGRRPLVLPLLVAALAYLVLGYGYGKPFGQAGDPSYFIKAGTDHALPERLPDGTYVHAGSGYDGQFFFYLAQDPLLSDPAVEAALDAPAYRYGRILLPVLGWLSSGGDAEILKWSLPLINLLAILGSGFVLAGALAARGLSPWLSLVYMLSLGPVLGLLNDVSDPLAAGLLVAGVVWWTQDRAVLALAALTLVPFARETYLAPVAAIALIELLRWRRRALIWLLPLVSFGAWIAYVRLRSFAGDPERDISEPSIVPFAGAGKKIMSVLREDPVGTANWELLFVVVLLAVWAYFLVRSVPLLTSVRERTWPSRAALSPLLAFLAVLLIPFLTEALWRNPLSYVRYGAPAGALLLLVYAHRRDRWAIGLALALFALSVANPLVGLLPTVQGPIITVG